MATTVSDVFEIVEPVRPCPSTTLTLQDAFSSDDRAAADTELSRRLHSRGLAMNLP